jgi:hypothetical protein
VAQILLVLDGIDDAVTVIRLDRLRRAAKQLGHCLVGALAECIPIGHVEAGDGHANEPLPAEQPEFRVHRAHQVERRDRFGDQLAADLLDQVHQGFERQIGIGEDVSVAGDALVGLDIDQHQRAGGEHAERSFYGTLERHHDGSRLHPADCRDSLAHAFPLDS